MQHALTIETREELNTPYPQRGLITIQTGMTEYVTVELAAISRANLHELIRIVITNITQIKKAY